MYLKKIFASIVLFSFYLTASGGVQKTSFCENKEEPCWPTENKAFYQNKPLEDYIQPTASGKVLSGTYGCVRNYGTRFHEGIDIKPIKHNRKGEPLDKISACLPGRVVYINSNPGLSTYGRYLVLEHKEQGLIFYSLYAHLSQIQKKLHPGVFVHRGEIIGQMGHSSCSPIPKNRAHLHFEIGMKIGSKTSFETWYISQHFPSRNRHGEWNGMNLVGLDPLAFFKAKTSFLDFFKKQKTAFVLTVKTTKIPPFIRDNSSLCENKIENITGWKIVFNWVGMPIKWTALTHKLPQTIRLDAYDKEELKQHGNRHTLEFDKKNNPFLGKILQRQLFELFEEYFHL